MIIMQSPRYLDDKKLNDFHPAEFPEITEELAELKKRLKDFHQADDSQVIISFVKDHLIRADLVASHPALTKILQSKGSCAHLENLFLITNRNTKFRDSLERYLKIEMSTF